MNFVKNNSLEKTGKGIRDQREGTNFSFFSVPIRASLKHPNAKTGEPQGSKTRSEDSDNPFF